MIISLSACAKEEEPVTVEDSFGVITREENSNAGSENTSEKISEEPTDDENASRELPKETAYNGDNAYLAYSEVLKAYKTGIEEYDWYYDDSKARVVAITDIDGDSDPELLFMSSTYYPYEADLMVFRYDPEMKSAVKCEYSTDEHEGEPQAFSDLAIDGGRSIMIYKGSDKRTLYMIYEQASGHMTAFAAKFLCEDNELKREWNVENTYDPSVEADDENDTYYIDGAEFGSDKGMKLFREANEDYGELVLFSGYSSAISAFSHVKTDEPLAMTFDQAVKWLAEQN